MNNNFEHSALEKDIELLAKKVREHRAELGEKEVDKEVVKALVNNAIYQRPKVVNIPGGEVQQKTITSDAPTNVLPDYLKRESPEVKLKIEQLMEEALHKGINHSINEAKKFGPFILDAFHDALTSKLYDELKNRGLIK